MNVSVENFRQAMILSMIIAAARDLGHSDGNTLEGLENPDEDQGWGVQPREFYELEYLEVAHNYVVVCLTNIENWENERRWVTRDESQCQPSEIAWARRIFDDAVEMRYEITVPRRYQK